MRVRTVVPHRRGGRFERPPRVRREHEVQDDAAGGALTVRQGPAGLTLLPLRGLLSCARRLQGTSLRVLAQRAGVIILPGSPRRARAPARAIALSDWLSSLVPRRPFPPPPGPPPPLPSSPAYPCTGTAGATGTLPDAFSTTSSPNWRAFRLNALTCLSLIWASYSSCPWRTYVIPCFSDR
jgi:hypothetical protein